MNVSARDWAVMLGRVATVLFLLAAVPFGYLSALLMLAFEAGFLGLLWVPIALMASLAGTFLLRERHDVAGVVLKLIALGPLMLLVGATGSPERGAVWAAVAGWSAVALLAGICVAAYAAWRQDPLGPSER